MRATESWVSFEDQLCCKPQAIHLLTIIFWPAAAFNLDFYTDVQDLSYLQHLLDQDPRSAKYRSVIAMFDFSPHNEEAIFVCYYMFACMCDLLIWEFVLLIAASDVLIWRMQNDSSSIVCSSKNYSYQPSETMFLMAYFRI